MTAKRRRGSLVFPLVLIAVGVLLLLSNLGLIEGALWPELLRFWPVLVIAVGLDLLLGRPSFGIAIGSIVFVVLGLVVGGALFFALAPDTWTSEAHGVSYPVHDVSSAAIRLFCERCSMTIEEATSTGVLIDGTVSVFADARLHQTASAVTPDGISSYILTTDPRFPFRFPSASEDLPWALRLSAELPLTLTVAADGPVKIDLRPFQVTEFDVTAGDDLCEIWLPERVDSTIHLSGTEIVVRVPEGVGVKVLGSPTDELTTPSGFLLDGNALLSSNYEYADVQALVIVRPATWNLSIEPVTETLDSSST